LVELVETGRFDQLSSSLCRYSTSLGWIRSKI